MPDWQSWKCMINFHPKTQICKIEHNLQWNWRRLPEKSFDEQPAFKSVGCMFNIVRTWPNERCICNLLEALCRVVPSITFCVATTFPIIIYELSRFSLFLSLLIPHIQGGMAWRGRLTLECVTESGKQIAVVLCIHICFVWHYLCWFVGNFCQQHFRKLETLFASRRRRRMLPETWGAFDNGICIATCLCLSNMAEQCSIACSRLNILICSMRGLDDGFLSFSSFSP
jgi:hypothetical protein